MAAVATPRPNAKTPPGGVGEVGGKHFFFCVGFRMGDIFTLLTVNPLMKLILLPLLPSPLNSLPISAFCASKSSCQSVVCVQSEECGCSGLLLPLCLLW